MAKLITRLHGVRVVLSPIPSGITPKPLWAGEYRTDDGHTLRRQYHGEPTGRWHQPVVTGATVAEVIRGLDRLSWWDRVTGK